MALSRCSEMAPIFCSVPRGRNFVRWCQEKNYQPIDTEYVTANTKMQYRCSCGAARAISWKRMRRGETGCQPCSKARGAAKRKYTIEQARERFLEKRLDLLERTYKNAHTRMTYVCLVCQMPGKMPLYTVNYGHGCKTCANRIKAAARRTSIAEVREIFEVSGLILLESEFRNNATRMSFRCSNGHVDKMTFKVVKSGGMCRKCFVLKTTGPGHHRWIEDREEAKLRKKVIEKCHDAKKHCLMSIDTVGRDTTTELLGYSPQQLWNHLVSFPKWPELSKGRWHLDHIYPIIAFIEYGVSEINVINGLDNLQPLDARANLSKAGSYDREKFEAYLSSKGVVFKRPHEVKSCSNVDEMLIDNLDTECASEGSDPISGAVGSDQAIDSRILNKQQL